jgi:hypothetical protein
MDGKNNYFFHIFSYNLPTGTLSSVKINVFLKFCVKILFCKHYISPLNTFMKNGKDPDPDPELDGSGSRAGSVPLTDGSGSGRPKSMRILISQH